MELGQFLITSLIIPLIMVVCGFFMKKGRPKKVNWWIGYRTPMACKNQETWVFAHKYVGKLWVPLGFILIILSIGVTVLVEHGIFASEALLILVMAQLIAVLLSIILTEVALKKEFDKNGERRL